MTLEKRAIFIPAVGPQFWGYWKNAFDYKGHDFKWFTESSLFSYPFAFVSFGTKDTWYWRDESGYPEDGLIITDSGGFQIAKGKSICPEASLRWQEDNCDIGFNLDVPIINGGNLGTCLAKSVENFRFFEKKRKNYNMKLYNVLHGRTLQEIETWYNAVENFNFDGWAIGVKGTIYKQILGYMVLHEKDALNLENSIHLFGTSNLQSMLVLAMLSKHFDTAITFDSSSYSQGARVRDWYFPLSIRHSANFGKNAKKSMTAIPCSCPVCSHTTIEDLYSQTNPAAHLLIALHNLYQFIETNRLIDIMVRKKRSSPIMLNQRESES